MDTNVVAEYHEKRFEGTRTFKLYSDRANIKANLHTLDAELNVALSEINPDFGRVWVRSSLFKSAQVLFLVSVGLTAIVAQFTKDSLYVGFCSLSIFGTLELILIARKKIEYAQCLNQNRAIVLDVARAGPSAQNFDAFVKAISDGATNAKQQTSLASVPKDSKG